MQMRGEQVVVLPLICFHSPTCVGDNPSHSKAVGALCKEPNVRCERCGSVGVDDEARVVAKAPEVPLALSHHADDVRDVVGVISGRSDE
jgi:hypothetical protein